jgi:hypothetical protein
MSFFNPIFRYCQLEPAGAERVGIQMVPFCSGKWERVGAKWDFFYISLDPARRELFAINRENGDLPKSGSQAWW